MWTLSERMDRKMGDAVVVSGEGLWGPGRWWGEMTFTLLLSVLREF